MAGLEILGLKAYADLRSVTLYWTWPEGVKRIDIKCLWKKPVETLAVYKSAYDVNKRFTFGLGPMDGGELSFELVPYDHNGEASSRWGAKAIAVAPPVRLTYKIREEKQVLFPKLKSAYIHIDNYISVDSSILCYRVSDSPFTYPLPEKLRDEVGPIILTSNQKIWLMAAKPEQYFLVPT